MAPSQEILLLDVIRSERRDPNHEKHRGDTPWIPSRRRFFPTFRRWARSPSEHPIEVILLLDADHVRIGPHPIILDHCQITGDVEGRIELKVSDSGKGLSTPDLERVFECFYRADPATSGGSGIGLTIARGIARAHGGDVVAHSDGPSTGATFTLVLPD